VETRRVWQVTQVEPKQGGVLHPHFSHDGNRLFWSERVSSKGAGWGTWVLKVADVRFEDDGPRVRSIETLKPADRDAWYEAHGFSPDDDSVIFTGNLEPDQKEMYCDIYRLNLSSRTLERLTRTLDQWDEHAHYTPGGRHILWMSSSGVGSPSSPWKVRTDYWVMNSDGSKKRRLTYFNEKGHRHEIPGGAIAADSAWSPDGKRLAAYLILSFKPHRAVNVMIEFNEPL